MVLVKGKPIPPLKKGTLGGPGFFSKPLTEQKRIINAKAKIYGENKIGGKLQAIATLNKNRNPALSKKAKVLRHYIAGNFHGKKKVRPGTGFGKSK